MKAKTTEQFIIEAKEVHGDKYDYSKVKYSNKNTIIVNKYKINLKIGYFSLQVFFQRHQMIHQT